MKKKIAVFENIVYGVITPNEEWAERSNDYTRLTEYVEIDFPELEKGTVIAAKVEKFQAVKEEMKEKFLEGMGNIDTKIQELLAIGFGNDPS